MIDRRNADKFRKEIPLFADMPENVFNVLDLSHFRLPRGQVGAWRSELERDLGHYLVSYRANVCNIEIPLETHLCALVKGADLIPSQVKQLNDYEARSKRFGVTYVVYQKPIEYIDPQTSAIAELYRQYGKLPSEPEVKKPIQKTDWEKTMKNLYAIKMLATGIPLEEVMRHFDDK